MSTIVSIFYVSAVLMDVAKITRKTHLQQNWSFYKASAAQFKTRQNDAKCELIKTCYVRVSAPILVNSYVLHWQTKWNQKQGDRGREKGRSK